MHDVVIVGAGAAGVGVGVALRHAGIDDIVLLDRGRVGESFERWPDETRFITPSFPTNSIGMLDLNSIAIGSSPAYSLRVEHPTGAEYASYLRLAVQHYRLAVGERTDVTSLRREGDAFRIGTLEGSLRAKHVIWAAGEFQYPRLDMFAGAEHCVHTATVDRYRDLDGDEFVVIGGYESGLDAAAHLARAGKRVSVFDRGCPWRASSSDPSIAVSTYTLERMNEPSFVAGVELHPDTPIATVRRHHDGYVAVTATGEEYATAVPPLLAGGFAGSHGLIADLFERRDDGFPLLSERDESTRTPGLFLCGPAVRHDHHVFCFIFKFRQRFAVVAKAIATALGHSAEVLEEYRQWGMFLDDLSCCGQECAC
ncbi:MAG: NAD(P)/FAD-dependent oxidoreductase [Desertimonas sp.]